MCLKKFLKHFIFFILLFPIACTHSINFEQKLDFFVESTGQISTNISVFITENDVKSYIEESGYSVDEFRSMEIENAVISTKNTTNGLNWVSSLMLSVTNVNQGLKKLYENTQLSNLSMGSVYTSLDLKIKEDYFLNFYKTPPFYLNLNLTGNNLSAGLISLSIKGTITVFH